MRDQHLVSQDTKESNCNVNRLNLHPEIMATVRAGGSDLGFRNMRQFGCAPKTRTGDRQATGGVTLCPWWEKFETAYPVYGWVRDLADHAKAVISKERVEASVRKCDVLPQVPSDNFYDVAMEYTRRMYSYCSDVRPCPIFDINNNTSPGKPYVDKFKTKGELIADPCFVDELIRKHDPVWMVVPKCEYLSSEDISRMKLRTYFIPDLPFLCHQKFWFDSQDNAIKKRGNDFKFQWSRYGFVRQYGGAHRLGSSMDGNDLYWTSDCSGYDRCIWLKPVYDLRRGWLGYDNMTDEVAKAHLDYVVRNTVNPICSMPDGTLFQKETGNSSGSGKTTVDNTLAHTTVVMYFLIKMHYDYFGEIPSFDKVRAAAIHLYGDDSLGGLRRSEWCPGISNEEFATRLKEAYALFGLLLKESQTKIQNSLEGLEFLGGTFRKGVDSPRCWVLEPRIGKILTSLTQILESKDPMGVASIVCAIMALTYDVPGDSERIAEVMVHYAEFLLTLDEFHSIDDELQEQLRQIRDRKYDGGRLIYGYESTPLWRKPRSETSIAFPRTLSYIPQSAQRGSLVFSHTPGFLEGGGFKSNMKTQNVEHMIKNKMYGRVGMDAAAQGAYISALQDLTNKGLFTAAYTFQPVGPLENTNWTCTSEIDGKKFAATAKGKKQAQTEAARLTWEYLHPSEPVKPCGNAEDSNELEDLDRWVKLVRAFRALQLPDRVREANEDNPLISLLDGSEKLAAARLAAGFKEGSFNKYGNGQASVLTITKITTTQQTDGSFMCSGTYQGSIVTNVFGSGETEQDAFMACMSNLLVFVTNDISSWSPSVKALLERRMLAARKLATASVVRYAATVGSAELLGVDKFSNVDVDQIVTFKEGGFNPYGHGQTSRLTKAEYMKMNMTQFRKLSSAQKEEKWRKYARQQPRKAPKPVRRQRKSEVVFGATKAQNASEIGVARMPRPRARPPTEALSDCSKKYAVAVSNPFGMLDATSLQANSALYKGKKVEDGGDACIPSFPPIKSRRVKLFMSGVFGTSSATTGYGNIAFAPRRLANNYPVNATSPPLIFSSIGAVVGASFETMDDNVSAIPAGYGVNQWNSDYSMAQLLNSTAGQGIQQRVVAAGLRIRYTGTELARGGIIHAIEEPTHTSLSSLPITNVSAYESHFRCAVTREWCTLTYTPVSTEELNYANDYYSNPGAVPFPPYLGHFIGFLIEGAVSAPFEYEAILLMEVQGSQVRDLKPATADITGMQAVINTITPSNQKLLNDDGPSTILGDIEKSVGSMSGTVLNAVSGLETLGGLLL